MKSTIYTILVGIVFVMGYIQYLHKQQIATLEAMLDDCHEVIKEQANHIPTFRDIQEMVGAEPDGRICKGWHIPEHSETLRLWELAINQQYADKWDYYYEDPNAYIIKNNKRAHLIRDTPKDKN